MQNGKRHRNKVEALKPSESNGSPTAAPEGHYDAAMVEHVRMVTSLFEGRKVSRREVLEMLAREEKRQQGIPKDGKTDYLAREQTEDSS